MKNCTHPTLSCLNPYEDIRKYRCHMCGEVMMCACEESFARQFLPHQLDVAIELETRTEVPVTLGFQDGICNPCRGLPEEAHPKAEMFRSTSKIVRYYWREIYFETIRQLGDWAERHGYPDWLAAWVQHPDIYKAITQEVVEDIKAQHQYAPKYHFVEESQSTVLANYHIEIVRLDGVYVKHDASGAMIRAG